MSESDNPWCACGHPQSFHKNGVGRCRCGCERLNVHGRRGGLEVLEQVAPGAPPNVAPTYRVRCPDCERTYETVAHLRDIATRARCRKCSDARRTAKKTPVELLAPPLADMPPAERFEHGVRARYVKGCRCEPCTDANRVYARTNQKLARMGQGNPLVSAAAARAHIEKLAAANVGRRQIADAAGTSESSITAIRHGTKTQLRRKTAAKILAVTVEAKADAALVDASRAWRIVRMLLDDGFTRQELARRLGSTAKAPALQLRRGQVLLSTEAAIERLYRDIHGKPAPRPGRPPGKKNRSKSTESAEAAE